MLRRGFTADELAALCLAATDALEADIACEVHSAHTIGGQLTYEYRGRTFRVGLELTEVNE